jgi:hypothetical protein
MNAGAFVVLPQALLQVGCEAGVALILMRFALQHIHVEHGSLPRVEDKRSQDVAEGVSHPKLAGGNLQPSFPRI